MTERLSELDELEFIVEGVRRTSKIPAVPVLIRALEIVVGQLRDRRRLSSRPPTEPPTDPHASVAPLPTPFHIDAEFASLPLHRQAQRLANHIVGHDDPANWSEGVNLLLEWAQLTHKHNGCGESHPHMFYRPKTALKTNLICEACDLEWDGTGPFPPGPCVPSTP